MRRQVVTIALMALFLLALISPAGVSAGSAKSSPPTFGTGPTEGEVLSGTITIVVSTTTGLDSAQLDLNDGNGWISLTNITSASSWIYN